MKDLELLTKAYYALKKILEDTAMVKSHHQMFSNLFTMEVELLDMPHHYKRNKRNIDWLENFQSNLKEIIFTLRD